MTTYRSRLIIQAVQYTGSPIPNVTCSGEGEDAQRYGCTGLKGVAHVHTPAMGGATRLNPGDWIFPLPKGGPFDVVDDKKFRSYWEVPEPDSQTAETENVVGGATGNSSAPIDPQPEPGEPPLAPDQAATEPSAPPETR